MAPIKQTLSIFCRLSCHAGKTRTLIRWAWILLKAIQGRNDVMDNSKCTSQLYFTSNANITYMIPETECVLYIWNNVYISIYDKMEETPLEKEIILIFVPLSNQDSVPRFGDFTFSNDRQNWFSQSLNTFILFQFSIAALSQWCDMRVMASQITRHSDVY